MQSKAYQRILDNCIAKGMSASSAHSFAYLLTKDRKAPVKRYYDPAKCHCSCDANCPACPLYFSMKNKRPEVIV